jgi:hypothetical protein
MAPPTTAAPPNEQPLSARLTALAQTLQFAWFVGFVSPPPGHDHDRDEC